MRLATKFAVGVLCGVLGMVGYLAFTSYTAKPEPFHYIGNFNCAGT